MSSMLGPGGQPPDPQAAGAATSGSYPTQSDPAFSALSDAAEDIQRFIQGEQDPQLKAEGAKLLAACHAIISGGEKQHDSALGLTPQLKFVQRQQAMQGAQGAQAGGGGGY